ncbi:MAG: MFS transporter [Thermoplasmata archaeon]|nr:MFS transporter [Thermoplasmata archaeon]MBE3142068.1 MFS transporter [Thermoplasmata archaeon]
MNKQSFFNGLVRNIIIVGFVSLFTDLSSQMVFPVVPLFLLSLGASAWVVGLVEGAAETTASLLKVFSGYWSDKIKRRKPFVFAGYSLSAITKPLFAFAQAWPFVLFFRVVERVGKGIRDAPRDAIIAESVDVSVRGKAYGFQRAMDGIGSFSGAIIAVILLPLFGYRDLFLIAFFPGIIAVLFILLIKEKRGQNIPVKRSSAPFRVSMKRLPRNLQIFIIVSTVFACANFGYAFLILKAKNIGLSDNTALLLYALFYIVYTFFTIPAGMLSDKIGRKPVLIAGYVLFAATAVCLLFTSQLYMLIFVFILYGIFFGIIDGVQRAFVVDLAPSDLKGTALGTFHAATGLIALPAGFIAGLLWDKFSPQATFLFALGLAICSLLMFSFVKNTKHSK